MTPVFFYVKRCLHSLWPTDGIVMTDLSNVYLMTKFYHLFRHRNYYAFMTPEIGRRTSGIIEHLKCLNNSGSSINHNGISCFSFIMNNVILDIFDSICSHPTDFALFTCQQHVNNGHVNILN